MRTKNELYQEALRTVALRRQTARALAQDAQAQAEAAIPALRHAEEEVRVRGIRCALAGAAGKDRTEAAAALADARQKLTALLAESGAWLSMQAFAIEDNTYPSPVQQAKHLQICNGTDRTYRLAKKHGVKLAWGTDLLFDPANTKNQNHGIVKLQKWFTNFEIIIMVTCDNARLLALSGARTPYPGNLGVIEEGALADLLVIEGNPLERIEVLENPHDNLRVIVKDGVVCKNTLCLEICPPHRPRRHALSA